MLFDCLLVHQVVRENPAAAVRGPKLSVTEGKTPNLPAEEVAVLIESIPTDTLVGLRLLPGGDPDGPRQNGRAHREPR